MVLVIGDFTLEGPGGPLPRSRAKAKRILRDIAKDCGVKRVHFVRTKHKKYGGLYRSTTKTIVVVEQYGSYKTPVYLLAYRFFHELLHHLQCESGLFAAFYYQEYKDKNGKWREYTDADGRRVALRAERHADRKASELAKEFFGLELEVRELYSREFLEETRKEIFECRTPARTICTNISKGKPTESWG